MSVNRRNAIIQASVGALALGGLSFSTLGRAQKKKRKLVLIQLKGGNDGLNTVVPFNNPGYKKLRPQLALKNDETVQANVLGNLRLHRGLKSLLPGLNAGDLAIVQGLGYPKPNRSHFRSIDIWHTGSDSDETLTEGWLASAEGQPAGLFAANIGASSDGPFTNIQSMLTLSESQKLTPSKESTGNARRRSPAVQHIARVQKTLGDVIAEANHAVGTGRKKIQNSKFPNTKIGRDLGTAAAMIAGGSGALFRVQHGSFDTHKAQRNKHERLLTQLADAIAAFRLAMIKSGNYDDVTIMTYSEFGRRAIQNDSGGCDHGTAAPHFIMGGRIRGGLYGTYPSLRDLDDGDLKYTVDFRSLYRTVYAKGLGTSPSPFMAFREIRRLYKG